MSEKCETCGSAVSNYRGGCPGCGAPECCQRCCDEANEITRLRAEVERLNSERDALASELEAAISHYRVELQAESQRARLPAELTAKLESAALIAERLDAQLIECRVLNRTDIEDIERLHFELRDILDAIEKDQQP